MAVRTTAYAVVRHVRGGRGAASWWAAGAAACTAVLCAGCVASFVAAPVARPWPAWGGVAVPVVSRTPPVPADTAAIAGGVGLADSLLAVYQRFLRRPERANAAGCAFCLSCSGYARQAVSAHGTVVGVAMTYSRLFLRELTAGDGDYQPVTMADGPCYYDPAR